MLPLVSSAAADTSLLVIHECVTNESLLPHNVASNHADLLIHHDLQDKQLLTSQQFIWQCCYTQFVRWAALMYSGQNPFGGSSGPAPVSNPFAAPSGGPQAGYSQQGQGGYPQQGFGGPQVAAIIAHVDYSLRAAVVAVVPACGFNIT